VELLSVVVPLFNEQETLPELCRRLRACRSRFAAESVEVLLIDDGSVDDTGALMRAITSEDPMFRGVQLSRNFGHQAAVSTGLSLARGDVIAVMDGDLQDPPEVIAELLDAMEREQADVAYAIRTCRKEHPIKRLAYRGFYRLLRSAASVEIPLDSGDFCVMRRHVAQSIRELPEQKRFIRGLRAWVGFKQIGVRYVRKERRAGRSKYSLGKLVGLAYDGLFSFSSLPVKLMQALGFLCSLFALLVAAGYLGWFLLAPDEFPTGWATLVISLWMLGGVQLLFLGLLGEYVHRTFDESRRRPEALIRELIGSSWPELEQDRADAGTLTARMEEADDGSRVRLKLRRAVPPPLVVEKPRSLSA